MNAETPSEAVRLAIRQLRELGQMVTLNELGFPDRVELLTGGRDHEKRMHRVFNCLAQVRTVRSLKAYGEQFSDREMGRLPPSDELRRLDLSGTSVSRLGSNARSKFPFVESVDVGHTAFANDGLADLNGLRSLRRLNLSSTTITDAGLARLDCPALEELALDDTDISDVGLAALLSDSKIQRLMLSHTLLTGDCIPKLAACKSLIHVSLTGSLITAESVESLRLERPNLTVEWEPRIPIIGLWADGVGALPEAIEAVEWPTVGGHRFIHPSRIVTTDWEPSFRAKVVSYLRDATPAGGWCGYSYCRFGCGHNGSGDMTDGAWLWPEGLAHYIEIHGVSLPAEFLTHVRSNQYCPPESSFETGHPVQTSSAFWRRWCRQQKDR